MKRILTRRGAIFSGTTAVAAFATGAQDPAGKKRVGFVDYDLNGYHPRVFLRAMREVHSGRDYEIAGCHAVLETEGRAWADENDVPYYETLEALNENVDFFMILAPSHPELHPELCEAVFPFGKPTYVDKTFAPDAATARKIFQLADRTGTPIQTTSALRYSNVQDYVEEAAPGTLRHMTSWVAGNNFNEYVIHPVELIVSCMGPDTVRLMRRGKEPETQLLVDFTDGRTGTVNVFNGTKTKYAASVTTTDATRYLEVDMTEIFDRNLGAILDFFDSGEPNVDRRETMAIMRILDAAKSPDSLDRFVNLAE